MRIPELRLEWIGGARIQHRRPIERVEEFGAYAQLLATWQREHSAGAELFVGTTLITEVVGLLKQSYFPSMALITAVCMRVCTP